METLSWDRSLHGGIAARIKQARRGKFSAQQLADETARLCYPITRSQIANYESGRTQGLNVTELLVLAAALEVPALSLLFPDRPDQQVELLPDVAVTSLEAKLRFVGERGALWPRREVDALIEQLSLINAGMGGSGELASSAAPVPDRRVVG